MDVVVVMAILALVVLFVSAPLRRSAASGDTLALIGDAAPPEVLELEAARDAKLRELRDAELDHRTGKLSDADYAVLDSALRAEALEILRTLDQVREGAEPSRPAETGV